MADVSPRYLQEVAPALLAETALSFTSSLGEFGAVIFIAATSPGRQRSLR